MLYGGDHPVLGLNRCKPGQARALHELEQECAESLHPGGLAGFWPHEDAQHCRLLRINEQHSGRSAVKWAGSECA